MPSFPRFGKMFNASPTSLRASARDSSRARDSDLTIGRPSGFQHHGHVGRQSVEFKGGMGNQIGEGEVDWLKQELRASARRAQSADDWGPKPQRAAWARAGAAATIAGKLRVRRLKAELERVEGQLASAESELSRRVDVLEASDAHVRNSLGGAGSDPGELPGGWVELMDPESGAGYFYQPSTGETTWERPEGLPRALADGWVSVTDAESGAEYYYHEASGETSWDRPSTSTEPYSLADAEAPAPPPPPAVSVPIWKAIGLPQARASERVADLDKIEEAVKEGNFEKAIELRDKLRLSSGRQNSVHQVHAEL